MNVLDEISALHRKMELMGENDMGDLTAGQADRFHTATELIGEILEYQFNNYAAYDPEGVPRVYGRTLVECQRNLRDFLVRNPEAPPAWYWVIKSTLETTT